MVAGAPLENARHLAQRYNKLRQETEAQVKSLDPPYHSAASVIDLLSQLVQTIYTLCNMLVFPTVNDLFACFLSRLLFLLSSSEVHFDTVDYFTSFFVHSTYNDQAIEVSKRQAKLRETDGNPESISKLEAAERKLQELKSNMVILGKEASTAMSDVEGQQQKLTLQRLITMVVPSAMSFL